MAEWGREPVWGSLPIDRTTSHVVTFDGGRVSAASHDAGDDVLVALGGEECLCHVLATTWVAARDHAAVIPLLLDPLPTGAVRSQIKRAAQAANSRVPPGTPPARTQAAVSSRLRQSFVTVAALLDWTFRTAMARHVAGSIALRWDEIIAEQGAGGERLAIEHAVRLALRGALPHLDQTKIETVLGRDGGLGVDGAGSVVITVDPRWLLDVAAADAVAEWWRASWS